MISRYAIVCDQSLMDCNGAMTLSEDGNFVMLQDAEADKLAFARECIKQICLSTADCDLSQESCIQHILKQAEEAAQSAG